MIESNKNYIMRINKVSYDVNYFLKIEEEQSYINLIYGRIKFFAIRRKKIARLA